MSSGNYGGLVHVINHAAAITDRALLTHRVKTMFGFDELALAVDEEAKEKAAYESLRYLI